MDTQDAIVLQEVVLPSRSSSHDQQDKVDSTLLIPLRPKEGYPKNFRKKGFHVPPTIDENHTFSDDVQPRG